MARLANRRAAATGDDPGGGARVDDVRRRESFGGGEARRRRTRREEEGGVRARAQTRGETTVNGDVWGLGETPPTASGGYRREKSHSARETKPPLECNIMMVESLCSAARRDARIRRGGRERIPGLVCVRRPNVRDHIHPLSEPARLSLSLSFLSLAPGARRRYARFPGARDGHTPALLRQTPQIVRVHAERDAHELADGEKVRGGFIDPPVRSPPPPSASKPSGACRASAASRSSVRIPIALGVLVVHPYIFSSSHRLVGASPPRRDGLRLLRAFFRRLRLRARSLARAAPPGGVPKRFSAAAAFGRTASAASAAHLAAAARAAAAAARGKSKSPPAEDAAGSW